jgi:hypothetical protein
MALELNQLTSQVEAMGDTLARRRDSQRDRLTQARELLTDHPIMSDELEDKIRRARDVDQWRRGCRPFTNLLQEHHHATIPTSSPTLIAVDGSQIYPDEGAVALYFLLNIGAIVLRLGSGQAPLTQSVSEVFFEDEDVYDPDGFPHTAQHVNQMREARELKTLAQIVTEERERLGGDVSTPIIAVMDGPLLPWIREDGDSGKDVNQQIETASEQMKRLRAAHAIPVGYTDRPNTAYVLRLLELLLLAPETITRESLRRGRFIRLADRALFADLDCNERSAVFTANTDANERYERLSGGDRICFVYVNVSRAANDPIIVRLETPAWVAADPALLDLAQDAIYANCEPDGYPYVLTRAHELAVVSPAERSHFEDWLIRAMLRQGMLPTISHKDRNKLLIGSRPWSGAS